jgi:hypothetical protein
VPSLNYNRSDGGCFVGLCVTPVSMEMGLGFLPIKICYVSDQSIKSQGGGCNAKIGDHLFQPDSN